MVRSEATGHMVLLLHAQDVGIVRSTRFDSQRQQLAQEIESDGKNGGTAFLAVDDSRRTWSSSIASFH